MFLANTLTSSKLLSVKDSSVGDHEKHKALGCAEREFTTKKNYTVVLDELSYVTIGIGPTAVDTHRDLNRLFTNS